MQVLFDNNVDWRFAKLLVGHEVKATFTLSWAEYKNGSLLSASEEYGFPVMITADKQMRHQQNMSGSTISVLVLNSILTDYPGIAPLADQVLETLETLPQGKIIVIEPKS